MVSLSESKDLNIYNIYIKTIECWINIFQKIVEINFFYYFKIKKHPC